MTWNHTAVVLLLFLAVAAGGCAFTSSPIVRQDFVCDSMPTPQCHASSIVDIDGVPAVAWFGGSHEGARDVGIWFARRAGSVWSTPVCIADGRDAVGDTAACWNPVLHRMQDGTVLLFYKAGPNPREWWGMMKTSSDGGRSWSAATRLPDGYVGPVRNHPLERTRGELLCPSSSEAHGWQVWMEKTTDMGAHWTRVGPLNDTAAIEAIQPALVAMPDGSILAVGRTKQGRLFRTMSQDGGSSWSAMQLCTFLCSNSGVDATLLADGRLLLVYDHARNDPQAWNVGRDTITVALSTDGIQWEAGCVLEIEKGAEFSYPSVMQTSDGLVHITYTWKRQKIRYVVLDPARLHGRPFRGLEWE